MTATRARAYSRRIGNTTFYVYVTPFLEDGKWLSVLTAGQQPMKATLTGNITRSVV